MRIFKAILLTVIKLPRTLDFCKACKLATKQHHERVQEMKQDRDNTKTMISEEVGPAHLWAWEAALGYLLEQYQLDPVTNQAKIGILTSYGTDTGSLGWQGVMEECHYFRLQDCFDKDSYRLEFKMKESSTAETVAEYLAAHLLKLDHGPALQGIPPQGDMETKIQDLLDSHVKK